MRTPIAFFVSYARTDRRLADTFLQRLLEQLAPSKRYAYTLWRDTGILVGERWHDEIQQALAACQLGLLLVSPTFLVREYITQQELPWFLGDGAKPIIPVMLKTIDLRRHDAKGLEHHQLFRLEDVKAFADCTTDVLRRRFAEQLFAQIEQRLDRIYGHP
ncbi:MAG: toll/interleukin-1 receptor domain-containing protein [Candidatus Entotheonellia bacterium]